MGILTKESIERLRNLKRGFHDLTVDLNKFINATEEYNARLIYDELVENELLVINVTSAKLITDTLYVSIYKETDE